MNLHWNLWTHVLPIRSQKPCDRGFSRYWPLFYVFWWNQNSPFLFLWILLVKVRCQHYILKSEFAGWFPTEVQPKMVSTHEYTLLSTYLLHTIKRWLLAQWSKSGFWWQRCEFDSWGKHVLSYVINTYVIYYVTYIFASCFPKQWSFWCFTFHPQCARVKS